MKNWLQQQLHSRLFRKLFLAIVAAAETPVIVMVIFTLSGWSTQIDRTPLFFIISVVSLFLLAAFIAAIIAIAISRYITQPIMEFEKSATEIARGNFKHEIKISSDNEIGRLAKLFNYMTIELRRLNRMNLAQIIAERNKTQTIIKNIADGVIVTDPNANVLILNHSTERWFNLQEGEAVERPLQHFIKEPKLIHLIEEAARRKRGAASSVEITVKPEGTWKPQILQARAARVLQDDGKLIGIVTILRDITQQKEIDRMKTELVSMVAHELRSPLTSISGFSELLLDDDMETGQQREYANIILTEATRLSELINKFLDISRIESGRIQPKMAEVDLNETIQMVVGNNSYLAAQKNIFVEVHEAPNLTPVHADSGMMEQVFINLFSNAIKYSPENTRIDIVLKNANQKVVVEVHDQGYGIPKEAQGKIFDKFFRVTEDQNVRESTGTGLGLSLVRQIVEMHGGRMELESEVGKGSVFSVILPKMHYRRVEQPEEDLVEIIY